MTSLPNLHILPLPQSQTVPRKLSRKRKQHGTSDEAEPEYRSPRHVMYQDSEYSVVITPDERAQRRLAGQDLKIPPPTHPFPHAATRIMNNSTSISPAKKQETRHSLRLQHLSAMITLLHKLLDAHDYRRAANALALILRTELNGKFIDARHANLWGIGAELLLRNSMSPAGLGQMQDGFGKSRLYYNKLALQHPWQRTWPSMTNAEDFKIALFGLWIQITCEHGKRLRTSHTNLGTFDNIGRNEQTLTSKSFELAEAEKIAHDMDALMNTVPYIDNKDLIRLRANVALWYADLLEEVDELVAISEKESPFYEEDMDKVYIESLHLKSSSTLTQEMERNPKVVHARAMADSLNGRLNPGELL